MCWPRLCAQSLQNRLALSTSGISSSSCLCLLRPRMIADGLVRASGTTRLLRLLLLHLTRRPRPKNNSLVDRLCARRLKPGKHMRTILTTSKPMSIFMCWPRLRAQSLKTGLALCTDGLSCSSSLRLLRPRLNAIGLDRASGAAMLLVLLLRRRSSNPLLSSNS